MTENKKQNSFKYAVIPVLIVVFLAIYPQLTLWTSQGSNWKGSYFVSNYDEVAYSAYVNALINGKARRNDPFLGREGSTESAEPETLYSIQFIPAYAIALPARFLRLSASSAFIFLILLIAAFSALSIFWLLREITYDDLLSAAGVLVTLCLGTAVAFQGELRFWLEGRILADFFPFLRRYQPGFAFPLFFVFCVWVWRSMKAETRRTNISYALLSGLTLAVLIFSYFYLWTAALAWLGCLTMLYLIWFKEARVNTLITGGIVAAFSIAALVPYFLMLADRSSNLDSVQLLTATRMPNFASPSMMIGLGVAAASVFAVWRGMMKMSEPRTLFTLSFALTPLILFNQQIVTGRSLQPVHYELFIANYLVLTSLILFISIVFQHFAESNNKLPFRRGLVYVGVAVCVWGVIESTSSTSRNSIYAEIRDESIPAIHYIQRQQSIPNETVLATNFVTADFLPTVSTLRPLWNSHTSSAGGVDVVENKRLFYLYLYYSGYSEKELAEALRRNTFEVTAAIFGSDRALPALGDSMAAVSQQEIAAEAQKYAEFTARFDLANATNPKLSHLIVPAEAEPDYSNLDRWYVRDAGTTFRLFKVYKLQLK